MWQLGPGFGGETARTVRVLARHPRANAAVILVLAVGIGGATGVLATARHLLAPVPSSLADRLVVLQGATSVAAERLTSHSAASSSFAVIATYRTGAVAMTVDDFTDRATVAAISVRLPLLFGVRPRFGRPLEDADTAPASPGVALVGSTLVRRLFPSKAMSEALGKMIELDGYRFSIVGIMPDNFRFPGRTEVWIPERTVESERFRFATDFTLHSIPSGLFRATVGLLRPRVLLGRAQSEVDLAVSRLKELNTPRRTLVQDIVLRPLGPLLVRDIQPTLALLTMGSVLLLLVTSASVANMLSVRQLGRRREMATRLVLGGTMASIVRGVFVETTLLSLVGGALGIAISLAMISFFQHVAATRFPDLNEVHLDVSYLAVALTLSLIVSIGIVLLASSRLRGLRLSSMCNEYDSLPGVGFLERAMVMAQVGIALFLLVSASLLVQSLLRIDRVDSGFSSVDNYTVQVLLPESLNMRPVDSQNAFAEVESELLAMPEISAAGLVSILPLSGERASTMPVRIIPGTEETFVQTFSCTPGYFRSIGIALLEGRLFTDNDSIDNRKIAIVNRAFAKRFWGTTSPVGGKLIAGEPREIVGVVNDVHFVDLAAGPSPQMYLPMAQTTGAYLPRSASAVFTTSADPSEVIHRLDLTLRQRFRGSLLTVRSLGDVVGESATPIRLRGMLATVFAAVALLLAVFGLYGVTSQSITVRMREIGVRVSLGATPASIVGLFLKEALWLSIGGTLLGSAGILIARKRLGAFLVGLNDFNDFTVFVVIVILLLILLAVSTIPPLRASRLDPSATLRRN